MANSPPSCRGQSYSQEEGWRTGEGQEEEEGGGEEASHQPERDGGLGHHQPLHLPALPARPEHGGQGEVLSVN